LVFYFFSLLEDVMSLNTVIIQGNLVGKPTLKVIPRAGSTDVKVGNFTVAVSRSYQKKNSDVWEQEVSFVDVELWDSAAQRAHDSLDKGDPVIVEGSLKQDKWQNDAGENRSKLKVRSTRYQKLPRHPAREEGSEVAAATQPVAAGADTPDDIPF
jgi:single-strand DNA-binding protein